MSVEFAALFTKKIFKKLIADLYAVLVSVPSKIILLCLSSQAPWSFLVMIPQKCLPAQVEEED